jgi:hypothetical protein
MAGYYNTYCMPILLHHFDFQEIPIQNVFNFVHNYKAASHFPDDKLGKKLSYIWVGMVIKIAIITLAKTT